ncbi:MAG: UDP-N-acetylmuramyl-tripeptide synthetase [Clostridia bacterium]|nr:UDP-N-acetylmuramyl-tripeptide synthetase [Clostridia bacterium]
MINNINKNLNELIEILKENNLLEKINENINYGSYLIGYLSYDSKDITKNTLFFCKGQRFKEEYLIDAIKSGAIAYISENTYENIDSSVPHIIVNDIRKAMSIIANHFYNKAYENFKLVGITGTKGKTTTTFYIKNILDEYSKTNTAYISTIRTYTGTTDIDSHLTTPETLDLHKYFYETSSNDIPYLTMEVASQGYKVGRVDQVTFDVGVFLNISEDHISPIEHPDIQDYLNCKLKLLENSKVNVVNMDTDYSSIVLAVAKKSGKLYTYGKSSNADYYLGNIVKLESGYSFDVISDKYNYNQNFVTNMQGLFNVENALASIVVAKALGVDDNSIRKGLENTLVEGRMTTFVKGNVATIVDYAHNFLSFEKLYETLRNDYPDHKIVTVFGCPGNKAYTRRRDLGILSAKNSYKIYLTEEDPQYENVSDICRDIITYVEPINQNYVVIEDRETAIISSIEEAITAGEKTVIAITGKGAETMQKVNGRFAYYKSDITVVKETLQ